ncbi:hypothetical protein JCM10049v2_006524 [Rhodotorula toruloides]
MQNARSTRQSSATTTRSSSPSSTSHLLPFHSRLASPDLASAPSSLSPSPHASYDVSPDPNASTGADLDDDKEIERTIAYLEASTTERSSGPSGLALFLRRLSVRNLSRRAVLVALVGVAALLTLAGAARTDEAGERIGWNSVGRAREVLGGLARTPSGLKSAVYDRWSALKWSRLGAAEEDMLFDELDLSQLLNYDGPAATLKEQLKDGIRYVTASAYGGHANQMIGIQKLLYFAKLTNRVAIIPTLWPIHIDGAQPANISDFYDLDRFWHESHIAAVEMSRIKAPDLSGSLPQNENLSCWSIQEATVGFPNLASWSFDFHDIWVNYWPLPPLARSLGGFDIAFDALRVFDFDEANRREWVAKVEREHLPQRPLPEGVKEFKGNTLDNFKEGMNTSVTDPPDDQIMCFDNTLFMGPIMFPELPVSATPLEPGAPGEGLSWANVGRYMHFNSRVEEIVDDYLMRLFDVSKPSKVPPFISIHLRRGDFLQFRGAYTDLDNYKVALGRVQAALQARLDDPDGWTGPGKSAFRSFGIKAKDYAVVCTTDEKGDSDFVKEVRGLGWKVIDHDACETKEKYGAWWPTIIDSAVLARGRSFVGTDRSTYSHLAGLRVKYWQGGLVELTEEV